MPSVTLGVGLGAPSTTMAGATLTYNLGVGNMGPDAAQNFSLTDLLPAGVTFVSQTQTGGPAFSLSYSGGQVSDTLAALPAGSSASFTIVVSVPTNTPNNTSLVDHAGVTTTTQLSSSSTTSASVTTTVQSYSAPAGTSLGLTTSANPSPYGQAVIFTAVVASAAGGTPTGTVSFADGGTSLGTATLAVVNGHDPATLSTSALTAGSHTITATYTGNGSFQGSGGTLTQVVLPSLSWVGPTFNWSQSQSSPAVAIPVPQMSAEGDTVLLQIAATDPNGSALGFDAVNLPPGLTVNATTGLISGTIGYQGAEDFGGSYPIVVLVTDAQGTGTEISFTWTVSDTERPPTIAPVGNQTNVAGDTVSVQLGAMQPDGDPLFFEATGLPPGLDIDTDTGLILGTIDPSAVSATPYAVMVTATDETLSTPQSVSRTFNWTVSLGTPSPFLENPGDQANAVGGAVDLSLNAIDGGGYALTYSASGLPASLSIDPETGEISGTIAGSALSLTPYGVTVTASDGQASSTQIFSWAVSAVAMADPGDQSNAVGDPVSLPIFASDVNNSTLTYSATGLPGGLTIDGSTGLISGTIATGGTAADEWFDVVVTATDGTYSTNREIGWTIISLNNSGSGGESAGSQLGAVQAQAITATTGQDTGNETVATFTDADPNADVSYFTATIDWGDGTSDEGSVDGSGGTFGVTGSHVYAQPGTYTTSVSVADGIATAQGSGSATVGDAPLTVYGGAVEGAVAGSSVSATWASFTVGNSGAAGSYTATIDWGDGTLHTAGTVTGLDGDFVIGGSHTYAQKGAYTVTVTVVDPSGISASATSTAEVGDVYAGINSTLSVASFTSSDPNATSGQFTATVDWGDGSGVDLNVAVTGSNGTFTVHGSHTYAVDSLNQPGGAHPVTVTVSSAVSGATLTTVTSGVCVERPPVQGVAEDMVPQPDGTARPVGAIDFFPLVLQMVPDADPAGLAKTIEGPQVVTQDSSYTWGVWFPATALANTNPTPLWTITDAATGQPVAGVTIQAVGRFVISADETQAIGYYVDIAFAAGTAGTTLMLRLQNAPYNGQPLTAGPLTIHVVSRDWVPAKVSGPAVVSSGERATYAVWFPAATDASNVDVTSAKWRIIDLITEQPIQGATIHWNGAFSNSTGMIGYGVEIDFPEVNSRTKVKIELSDALYNHQKIQAKLQETMVAPKAIAKVWIATSPMISWLPVSLSVGPLNPVNHYFVVAQDPDGTIHTYSFVGQWVFDDPAELAHADLVDWPDSTLSTPYEIPIDIIEKVFAFRSEHDKAQWSIFGFGPRDGVLDWSSDRSKLYTCIDASVLMVEDMFRAQGQSPPWGLRYFYSSVLHPIIFDPSWYFR